MLKLFFLVFTFVFCIETEAKIEYKQLDNSCTQINSPTGFSLKNFVGSGVELDIYYWSGVPEFYPWPMKCAKYIIAPRDGDTYTITYSATYTFWFLSVPLNSPSSVMVQNPLKPGQFEAFPIRLLPFGPESPVNVSVLVAAEDGKAVAFVNCPADDGTQTKSGVIAVKRSTNDEANDVALADKLANQLRGVAVQPFNKVQRDSSCRPPPPRPREGGQSPLEKKRKQEAAANANKKPAFKKPVSKVNGKTVG